MTVCFPLVYILRRFRCPSRKRRCGKRPETFLTPYEMELVPLMLKELRQINPRFFETVSFRWFKEAVGSARETDCCESPKSEPLPPNSLHIHPPATMHEFQNEGVSLEELITCVAKSLMNNGTFDEQCEEHIAAYRRKREQWKCINSVVAVTAATLAAPTLLRSRSFSAAVAAPPITTSRFCGTFCAEDADKLSAKSLPKRLSRLTTKKRNAMRKLHQTDLLFVQLGEVLVHQFQCCVGLDKDGNVHERELKLLIWRHFVQMLVAILTDRARFPYKANRDRF
ncbi:hypothetical protein M3Y97_00509300 [Aphelenchoides bicaudatus]|nr:hypothetical protein M3Y97_00509300 [Aphelenchoides bicaudatus]